MVKTTISLDDEIYKKLIKESIERFGSTKKLSWLINEKLRLSEKISTHEKSIVEKTFGLWKEWKVPSKEYVRRIRKESEKRLKRMGL